MDIRKLDAFVRKYSVGGCFILLSILGGYISYGFLFGGIITLTENRKEVTSKTISLRGDSEFNERYLTHKLINIDYEEKITNESNKNKALRNVNGFLNDVKADCDFVKTDAGTWSYIKCANEKLHDNFYYKPSIEVSNNYAIHASDCDTNTYMMIDALTSVGVKAYAIFAPSHAFLGWKDSRGNIQYWETTTENNKGEKARLQDKFYTKTLGSAYYKPVDEPLLTDVYKTLISGLDGNTINLTELWKKNKDNSIISDWYYFDLASKGGLSREDSLEIESLLGSDIASNDKRQALVLYYLNVGDAEKAKKYFNSIDKSRCGDECYELGVKTNSWGYNMFKNLFTRYKDFYEKNKLHANVQDFWLGIITSFISFFIFLLGIKIIYNKAAEGKAASVMKKR